MIGDVEAVKAFNLNLLEEVGKLCKDYYGENSIADITKDEVVYSLCTDNFILMFTIPDLTFYLSFKVSQKGKSVAQDTKLIMRVLEYDEFCIIDDSYFSKELNKLLFGTDATDAKNKDLMELMGKSKCPMCDKIGTKEYFIDSGICIVCDGKKDKMVWN